MVKKILKITLWVVTGAALIVLFVYGRKWYLETPLKGIRLQLERCHEQGFVDSDSVIAYATTISGMENKASIASVDLLKIRKMLDSSPWIATSSAYIDLSDTLYIKAKEYEPLMRVYNHDGRSVYLTKEGVIIPSSPRYTPHVIIASGSFDFAMPQKGSNIADSLYQGTGLTEVLTIAKVVSRDSYLREHIGQIHKDTENKYELMVNTLPSRVILGDTLMVADKLARLKTLLKKYEGSEELMGYKTLSLEYNHQIVCTKK